MQFSPYTLSQLAQIVQGKLVTTSSQDPTPTQLSFSSHSITPGTLYVAINGTKHDGHDFIEVAMKQGALAAVVNNQAALKNNPGIVVQDTRVALSRLAALFSGDPGNKLKCIGITGTNGKTTVHWLIYHTLEKLGAAALRIGTIGYAAPGISDDSTLTTPDPILLQGLLRKGLDVGACSAVMEVSSHALHQHRVTDVYFDVGVFTNLTQDHLDYHGTMEEYYKAKECLFNLLAKNKTGNKVAVINRDDPYGKRYIDYASSLGLKVISYGQDSSSTIKLSEFSQNITGSSFILSIADQNYQVQAPSIGIHNAYNFAAAIGALYTLKYPTAEIIQACATVPPVLGRLEPVGNKNIGIYVDYAHTPDALENVLKALRRITDKHLWVVFGCGGDRDRTKRPIMAAIALKYADRVCVTSDNPRTEDPQKIINDILSTDAKVHSVIIDRRAAIKKTVLSAEAGDVILIAGKGHENYQIIGTEKHYFSDQDEVRMVLQEINTGDKD